MIDWQRTAGMRIWTRDLRSWRFWKGLKKSRKKWGQITIGTFLHLEIYIYIIKNNKHCKSLFLLWLVSEYIISCWKMIVFVELINMYTMSICDQKHVVGLSFFFSLHFDDTFVVNAKLSTFFFISFSERLAWWLFGSS